MIIRLKSIELSKNKLTQFMKNLTVQKLCKTLKRRRNISTINKIPMAT